MLSSDLCCASGGAVCSEAAVEDEQISVLDGLPVNDQEVAASKRAAESSSGFKYMYLYIGET